ncbi:MAG TPA: M48 family metalloprotease [Candidatus Saccharibacteria bacterium]|nr:M48 family metalloprotease [Candidatus Saccharibacteria bacterium]
MYGDIRRNKFKTWLIMLVFFLIMLVVATIGYLITGRVSTVVSVLIGSIAYSIISYFISSRTALAVNGAKEVDAKTSPRLYRTVENIAITNGMPMPRVFIMQDASPNAFATGRNPNKSYVCATSGLLDIMDDNELQGVIAHEMGHIKNYDIRVSMVAFALVSVISMLSDIILRSMFWGGRDDENSNINPIFIVVGVVALILAPLAASLVQLAISRKREYLADATGALTTRYPEGLASALEKIGRYGSATKIQNASTAHMFFANPLKAKSLMRIFSTHPPIEDRVAKLRGMSLNG